MASKLVKWTEGASGVYAARIIGADDWKAMGFKGDDAKAVEFNKTNNFQVVGDDLPGVQLDYFESSSEFKVVEVKNPDPAPTAPSAPTPASNTPARS